MRDRSRIEHATRDSGESLGDGVAFFRIAEKHDAAAATSATDLTAPRACGSRRFDRGIDLRSGDAVDERFSLLPLFAQRRSCCFEVPGFERTLHLDRDFRDLVEALGDLFLFLDVPLVQLPVVRSREMRDTRVVQQHVPA